MKLLAALVYLCRELLAFVRADRRRRAARKAQEERDALEADPADWFDGHFGNGMREHLDDDAAKTPDPDAGDRPAE